MGLKRFGIVSVITYVQEEQVVNTLNHSKDVSMTMSRWCQDGVSNIVDSVTYLLACCDGDKTGAEIFFTWICGACALSGKRSTTARITVAHAPSCMKR